MVRCLEVRGRADAVGDLIRLHPQRIISFGIDQPDTEPHSLRPHARDVA